MAEIKAVTPQADPHAGHGADDFTGHGDPAVERGHA
jgi:hypothetical protein